MDVNVVDQPVFTGGDTCDRGVASNRHPRSVVGKMFANHYDITNGEFIVAVKAGPGDQSPEWKIRIPFTIPRSRIDDVQVRDSAAYRAFRVGHRRAFAAQRKVFTTPHSHRRQKASQHISVYQKETTLPKRRCPRRDKPARDNGAKARGKPNDAPTTKPWPCVKTMLAADALGER